MKKRPWLKLISLVTLTLVTIVALAGCGGQPSSPAGQAQPAEQAKPPEQKVIELTIASGHPAVGQPYVAVASAFFVPEVAKRVKEKTGITIKWNEAYAGSIAKLAEVLEATESGLIQVGLVTFPFEPTKLFLHNFNYYIPFNTPDAVQAARITGKVFSEFKELTDVFEKQYNQIFLGLGAIGNYQLITTFPVEKVADLKGKKIAAAGPNLPFLTGTGAIPVQSNLNEAYTSFQTGVYQGWIMYDASTYGFKLHEVAKYRTTVDFGAVTVTGITVNLDTWKKLPKEVQDIMIQVAKEYEVKAAEEAMRYDMEALEKMKEAGVVIKDLPVAEKEKWAAGLPNIPNEKAKEADKTGMPGSKVIGAYIKYLEEEGYKFPRKWVID